MSSAEHIIDELVRDLEMLQNWHIRMGMHPGIAARPGGHVWYKENGVTMCWCPHDDNHTESPLVLYKKTRRSDG